MRVGILIVAALVCSGCNRNRAPLEAAVASIQAEIARKQLVIESLAERAKATMDAERKVKELLDGGAAPEPELGAVSLVPVEAPVVIPEKAAFEGMEELRLRQKIDMLRAEEAALDKMINDMSELERRKRRAEAQLKMLEAMGPDGGER
jgi:hypothetical protein